LRQLVRLSTRLTHTDPKAEYGAFAVALAAHMAGCSPEREVQPHEYVETLRDGLGHAADELIALIEKTAESAVARETTEQLAESLNLDQGITRYVYATVPVAIHAWLRNQKDLRTAVLELVRCGGDTDTTAAIVGGIIGASVGKGGIPQDWLDGLCERPRNAAWLEELGARLASVVDSGILQQALPVSRVGVILRNVFFLAVVLIHGFRRLLPPY
jgi:ADP-ribosylglycohydrolase